MVIAVVALCDVLLLSSVVLVVVAAAFVCYPSLLK